MIGAPLSQKFISWTFFVLILLGLLFATVSTYPRRETVSGWLYPSGGIIRVAARQGGVVEAIYSRKGEAIGRGAPLVQLRLSNDIADGDVGTLIEGATNSEMAANNLEVTSKLKQLATERDEQNSRRAALLKQRQEAIRQVEQFETQVSIAKRDFARALQLHEKGYLSERDLDSRKSAEISAETLASQARVTVASLGSQITDIEAQLRLHPVFADQAMAQAQTVSAEIQQKSAQNRANHLYTLTSPVTGKISVVPIEVGQYLAPAATAEIITPVGAQLQAELYVPSRSIGFIKPGQDVYLRFQAFPYAKFGTTKGKVLSVSEAVLAPTEIPVPGLVLKDPAFRVRTSISRDFVEAYGLRRKLQPGMLLDADIVIDRRSLIEWILDPIYAVGRRG